MKLFSRWTFWIIRNRVIQAIQWLAVQTSFPPFSWLYSSYYRLTVWGAVQSLKGLPEVKAIYLTGSLATGDVIYGLSDIDLIVFVDDNDSRVRRRYGIFGWFFPLAGGTEISVYSSNDLPSILEKDLHLKYKFSNRASRSRLIHGEDVVAPFKKEKYLEGAEAARGRLSFLWRFITRDVILNRYHFEQRHRYICRKTLHHMNGKQERLCGRSAIRPDPNLREETFSGCMQRIREYAKDNRLVETGHEAIQEFEIIEAKPVINSHNSQKIQDIVEAVRSRLGKKISSILVSPISLFPADEEDLGLFLVEEAPISLSEAKLLSETAGGWATKQKLSLYITSPDVAISINRYDEHPRTVLWPHDSPLTFLQLASGSAVIDGPPLSTGKAALLQQATGLLTATTRSHKNDFFRLKQYLHHPNAVRLPVVDLQLLFWQILQEISLRRDKRLHQSSATLAGDWKHATGHAWIEALGSGFGRDLEGLDSDTESLYQPALKLLSELCA